MTFRSFNRYIPKKLRARSVTAGIISGRQQRRIQGQLLNVRWEDLFISIDAK